MKIKILKGTNEIGGSCVKLSTNSTTILLDYGTPLNNKHNKVYIKEKIDAILISHPHQDHFGEIININNKTPIYCGEVSLELMNATKIFTGNEKLSNNFQHFKAWEKFTIGDFTIKAFLVDHSATDAYAFLVEANNQRILYSGDFRANGRKSILFNNMLNNKELKNLDVLIMEGTMMKRDNLNFPDEKSVENKIHKVITKNENLSFLIGSSQNIDNLVSAYRACKKANKILVIDIYTAWILEVISKRSNVPNISWDNIKVIKQFGGTYYEKIKKHPDYFKGFPNKLFKGTITLEELQKNQSKYLLKISPWHIDKLLKKIDLSNINIIYSQWLGYLKDEFNDEKNVELLIELKNKYNWYYTHTSGHANLESLKKFTTALNPRKLIPIHTENKKDFLEHFENVLILEDNEEYKTGQKLSMYQANKFNNIFANELLKKEEK